MRTIHGIESCEPPLSGSVLLIGNFDGVHRGHQQLLAQGAMLATDDDAPLVVVTFEPHPLVILRKDKAPARLSPLSEKLALLGQHDVDITVVAEATSALLGLEAEAFIRVIVERFHPTHIVEGSTFGFGRGRKGTPQTLQALGAKHGYQACIIDPVRLRLADGETVPVSSSVVRRLLSEGKVHRAALCLGRAYRLFGAVAAGAGRGRGLGFPTANVRGIEQLIPADGVYAGTARMGDRKSLAGISIGTNPTFGGSERQVEAHLLDFAGDVYGESIEIEFGQWLRSQRTFESGEALARQIAEDIEAVRAFGASDAHPFRRRAANGAEIEIQGGD